MDNIKNSKSIVFSVIFFLLFSSLGNTFANYDYVDMPNIEKGETTETISKLEAIEIAKNFKIEFDGEEILESNFGTDYSRNTDEQKVYELFNMEEELIAYLILIEEGYIVVNADIENQKVLMSSEYGDSLVEINQKIAQDSKLYYIFPVTILTENEKDEYLALNGLNKEDVVSIPKVKDSDADPITPLTSNLEVSLRNETSFVRLIKDGEPYYGGDQDWFNSQTNKNKGCGVVALTNVVSHLAQYGYPNLYHDGNRLLPVNYNNYRNKMEGLAEHYLPPAIAGVPFVIAYTTAANKFFIDKGYTSLKSHTFSSNYAQNIRNGLSRNQPVAMLIWIDGSGNDLSAHWVTLTKYFKHATTHDQFVAMSTWGRRLSVNLDSLLSGYVRGATYMR